ncbi:MAG: thiamine pyrophosphate-binding protein [Clostridiales bacterium]|nr:thiamine pyrophosphate-binding protein [Clostridiales bacterium]
MKLTGGEIIVDSLIEAGVEYVLGIPGHGCLAFFDALRDRASKNEIKYIQVKQEMSAVHMADAYYRATGKPLAVFTSIGAGALNTAIGLGTAYVDSTSVLVITGDTHTHMRGVGVLQEVERKQDSDVFNCFKPITKRCWRVDTVGQLPRIMKRAFNQMLSGRKGPVLVSVPMDVQADSLEVETLKMDNRFAQELFPANDNAIAQAYALMKDAKRPVIVAGGGVLYSQAHQELIKLAETWGAAVVTTMAGKSAFPENHPLYGWHGGSKGTDVGNYLCRNADLVLALGCRFADETTSSYKKGATYNFPDTKLIHVDIDASEIGKNYPVDVGVLGDVKLVMEQLYTAFVTDNNIADYKKTGYFKVITEQNKKWAETLKKEREKSGDRVTISKVITMLNEKYPKEGIVVTSSGNSQAQILQEYCFVEPKTHITTGGLSTMGFAYPAALGAKLAKPNIPVLALVGDGDFMMTMQEMSTAVQYNINAIIIVVNNIGWHAIKDLQIDVYGKEYAYGNDFIGTDGKPYTPDFESIAKGFGMYAQKASSIQEAEKALENTLISKKPSLIEIDVTSEHPYTGGIATGWWDVPVPAYIKEPFEKYNKARELESLE